MSILTLLITFLGSLFKSQCQLVLENLALRQQVTMLRQSVKCPRATVADKLFCRAAHNPTHSTNPTLGINRKPLWSIIGVESSGSSGIAGACFCHPP